MKKVSDFVGKYMAIIVLVVAALALFVPKSCLWIQKSWINYLLMLVMFGMGLTLKPVDFALVFKRPKEILIGAIAQFTIMPLLAFALGKIFGLEVGLLAGVILVGTCPGGTASNVITYLSKGDVALSVSLTALSSIITLFTLPLIMQMVTSAVGQQVGIQLPIKNLLMQNLVTMLLPILIGIIIRYYKPELAARIARVLSKLAFPALMLLAGIFFV